MTTGTNTDATLSAMLATGALVLRAISIMRAIWNRTVSSPVFSALTWRLPPPLTVAPYTRSPTFLSTGMLSPVSMDSFTAELPETTVPSVGMRSPGRTSITSPATRSEDFTLTSTPSLMTLASSGAVSSSFLTESSVLNLERASTYFPTLTRAMIIAAESKHTMCKACMSPVYTR